MVELATGQAKSYAYKLRVGSSGIKKTKIV